MMDQALADALTAILQDETLRSDLHDLLQAAANALLAPGPSGVFREVWDQAATAPRRTERAITRAGLGTLTHDAGPATLHVYGYFNAAWRVGKLVAVVEGETPKSHSPDLFAAFGHRWTLLEEAVVAESYMAVIERARAWWDTAVAEWDKYVVRDEMSLDVS